MCLLALVTQLKIICSGDTLADSDAEKLPLLASECNIINQNIFFLVFFFFFMIMMIINAISLTSSSCEINRSG